MFGSWVEACMRTERCDGHWFRGSRLRQKPTSEAGAGDIASSIFAA